MTHPRRSYKKSYIFGVRSVINSCKSGYDIRWVLNSLYSYKSINLAWMPTNNNFVSGRNAQLLTVSSFTKIPLLFDHMHGHDHHHYKSILIVSIYADPDEVCHMVEELLPVFWVRNKYLSLRGRPQAAATWWALVAQWSHRKLIKPSVPYSLRTRSLKLPLPSLLSHF